MTTVKLIALLDALGRFARTPRQGAFPTNPSVSGITVYVDVST